MSDMKPINPIKIDDKLKEMELFKYHPSAMVELSLNTLSDILDGRVSILEPSNPISYNLEWGSLATAFAIQEYVNNTRTLYAKMANDEKALYKHMSDKDYLGLFSRPAFAQVSFSILYNDFATKAYVDPKTKDRILTIPRNTVVNIENFTFSLPTPIEIRRTEAGIVDVRYNNDFNDDVFPLETDYIDFNVITLTNQSVSPEVNTMETYLQFTVRLPEVKLETKEIIVEKKKLHKSTFDFSPTRLFYFAKAYHSRDGVNWEEIEVTHAEDVWDIYKPTVVIKVFKESKQIEYYIPPNYINDGSIGNRVRLVVYTTKGPINVNFGDFKLKDFTMEYNSVFPEVELSKTTTALKVVSISPYIMQKVIGGRGEKSFAQAKRDVINNNLNTTIPITDVQIEGKLADSGFDPVRNYDVVTGREYLVKTRIPTSISRYKISRMSLDLIEFTTSMPELKGDLNGVVIPKRDIAVLPQGTIFESDKFSGIRILTKGERAQLESLSGQKLATEVNLKKYLSLYYHYVLDVSGEVTQLRAYEINDPFVVSRNFKDYNNTTRIGVNTITSNISKIDTGYKLDFLTGLKIFDEQYGLDNITPYIVYMTPSGHRYFLEGKLYLATKDAPVYTFYIDTDGYVDDKDRIHVHNFKDANGDYITIDISLEEELLLLYTTDTIPGGFETKDMDRIIYGSYLAVNRAVVTMEAHKIQFGKRLKTLFSRVHTSTGVDEYLKHEEIVYKKYDKTIFNNKNEIIHRPGEFVLDDEGNKIIEYDIGDVVLDENGDPTLVPTKDLTRYLNVLLMDYKIAISNGLLVEEYKKDVRLTLTTLITDNMVELQKEFNDKTDVFLTVPNGLAQININYDGKTGYIDPAQSFIFDIYVNKRVYDDNETRKVIESTITETLDNNLTGNTILKRTVIASEILSRIDDFVDTIEVKLFTEVNAEYIELIGDNAEISIKKRLIVTPDGYDVRDDIRFNFIMK